MAGTIQLADLHTRIVEATLLARSLPYLDVPTRELTRAKLSRFFRAEGLATNQIIDKSASGTNPATTLSGVPLKTESIRVQECLQAGQWLQGWWTYAQQSGDWDLIRETGRRSKACS